MIPLIEKKKNKDYQIIWSVGQKQYEGIKERFENKGININKIENTKIVPYIYNMSEIMNAIDIIVSRSGAMTITEIALVGKPAIFIPLPSMSANRQVDNANVLAKLGAAKIILNDDLKKDNLEAEIEKIIQNPKLMHEMEENAFSKSVENVQEKIYNEIIIMLKI